MRFENNKELKKAVKNNVLNCKGENLICNFNININANIIHANDIKANDIKAYNIDAWNIKAIDINAQNIKAIDINAQNIKANDINANYINAMDINYFAVCCAYKNITCKNIKGRRKNSKHFCLDRKIIIKKRWLKMNIRCLECGSKTFEAYPGQIRCWNCDTTDLVYGLEEVTR